LGDRGRRAGFILFVRGLIGSLPVQRLTSTAYQGLLLGPWPAFDQLFTLEGSALGIHRLMVNQADRTPGGGVFGALAGIVGGQTGIEVVGYTGVQRSVRAAQDINVPSHDFLTPLPNLKYLLNILSKFTEYFEQKSS
jgi:hypothetical protein